MRETRRFELEQTREDDRQSKAEQREQSRFDSDQQRADHAARRAWRRDIDLRLFNVVWTELVAERNQLTDDVAKNKKKLVDKAEQEEQRRSRQKSNSPFGSLPSPIDLPDLLTQNFESAPSQRSLGRIRDDIDSMLLVLRNQTLTDVYELWDNYCDRGIELQGLKHYDDPDLGQFDEWVPGEDRAWQSFEEALIAYLDENYPD